MKLEDQLQFWEGELKKAEECWKDSPKEFYELHYWRDIVPYKHLVRMVRVKSGTPICWAALDCMEPPDRKCTSGTHECCKEHAGSCFVCAKMIA